MNKKQTLLILYIYIFFYKPYKNKKIIDYDTNNTNKLKIYQIFGNILGFIILNFSILINTLATKGYLIENYKYNNESSDFGKGNYGIFDHKYAFSFFETTGGSLMQYGATNSIYWCFPKCSKNKSSKLKIPENLDLGDIDLEDKKFSIHKFELFPRNYFGLIFKKIINISNPYFLIEKKINDDGKKYYKVNLITFNKLVSEKTLTDVWQILEPNDDSDAKIILSWKLRNYFIKNGYPISNGVGHGRSIFIAIDSYNHLTKINLNNLNKK